MAQDLEGGGMNSFSAGVQLGDKLHKNYNENLRMYYEQLQKKRDFDEQQRQFGEGLKEKRREFDTTRSSEGVAQNRKFGLEGIGMLAQMRGAAQQRAQAQSTAQYDPLFRSDLMNALRG